MIDVEMVTMPALPPPVLLSHSEPSGLNDMCFSFTNMPILCFGEIEIDIDFGENDMDVESLHDNDIVVPI